MRHWLLAHSGSLRSLVGCLFFRVS
jgi:hypothetical protein